MATLVIKGPDGSEQEHDFEGALTIGRGEGNDLVLAEGGVSRKHARFFVEGDQLMVEDLGSANGTIIDGTRIEGPTAVEQGAVVILGDYEVILKARARARARGDKPKTRSTTGVSPAAKRRTALATGAERSTKVMPAVKKSPGKERSRPPRVGSAGPVLRGLSGTVTGNTFPISGVMMVGRVAGVDIRVEDDSVSRRHAELEVRGNTVLLRDVGSANGTTVNGSPITGDTQLAPGDIIQFGIVELMFENGEAGARGSMARAPRGGLRRGRGDDEPSLPTATSATPMDPRKRRLVIIGAAVLTFLFVAVLVKGLTSDTEPVGDPSTVGPKVTSPKVDPGDEIEELIKVCRTYASCEGRQPDWSKAEAACGKVLDLEPIHEQANLLMKRILHEKAAEQFFLKGKELAAAGRRDDALANFEKVKPFSKEQVGCYFLETFSEAKPVIQEQRKALAAECKQYSSAGRWENALKACEGYMRLACQSMSKEELSPPYPRQLKLDGPVGKNDWRPSDANHLNLLRARQKLRPGDAPWACVEIPAFKPPPPPPDPRKGFYEELQTRYAYEPEFGKALRKYFDGAFAEARIPLQRITENVSKARYHDEAKAMLLDIDNAASFFRTGQTELNNDKPEKAEEPFRKALALDEKLVLGEAAKGSEEQRRKETERRTSFLRKGILEGMAGTCYLKGKVLWDKQDFRAACRVWKLGLSFTRANNDLLRAGYDCTQKAGEALQRADSCKQLEVVLDLAVEGDSIKDKVKELAEKNGCN